MFKLFQDEQGEWRYQISGKNNEIMATSEGYTRKADAKRGYWDLVDLIVDAHTTQGAPGDFEREHSRSVIDAESEPKEDVQEAPEDGEGKEAPGEGFSRHDEVPFDNPDALRSDDED